MAYVPNADDVTQPQEDKLVRSAADEFISMKLKMNRALRIPGVGSVAELPGVADRANKFLGFDAGGEVLMSALIPGGADATLRADLAAIGGSALVGWSDGGTGAVQRSVQQLFRDLTTPKNKGAVGDGLVNDATPLQNTINDASGKVIDGLGLTYKCNSGLTLPANTWLRNITLNFSSAPLGATLLSAAGAIGANVALSANAAVGATTVSVVDASSFTAGGYAWISSTSVFENTTNATRGEIVRIKAVDVGTDVLTLYAANYFAYNTVDSAVIAPLTFVENITLENVRCIGAGTGQQQTLANFTRCKNVTIMGCKGDLFEDRNIQFDRCLNAEVLLGEYQRTDRAGFGYGVVIINGSRNISVLGVTGRYMRHLVATGGSSGINLSIKAAHCHALDVLDAGFDAHPNCDDIDYSYNSVWHASTTSGNSDGIICQGKNFTAIGNRIYGCSRYGVFHQSCHNSGNGSSNISDNYVEHISTNGVYGVLVQTNGAGPLLGVQVKGNRVKNVSAAHCIVYAVAADITHIVMSDNVALTECPAQSMQLRADDRTLGYAVVSGNLAWATLQPIYLVGTGTGTVVQVEVAHNVCRGGSNAYIRGVLTDYITYGPNVFQGGGATLHNIAGSNNISCHILKGSATKNPGSLADGARESTTVTVTGAKLGDPVDGWSFSLDTQGVSFIPRVSAADTVTFELQNETGGVIDLGSGTLTAYVRAQ